MNNEQLRAVKFLDGLAKLTEEFNFRLEFDPIEEKIYIVENETRNAYDIEE